MEPSKGCERQHDFVLVLTVITELTTEVEDALFEAGCDDATISVRSRRVFLTFSRTAASLKDAILSAIRDVKKAKIAAAVLRVDVSGLVTQADIARKIGRNHKVVHQYITGFRGPGGFPAPVGDSGDGVPLWSWCEVASWLSQSDMIKEEELREVNEVAAINSVLELQYQRQQNPALTAEILQFIADPQTPH